MKYFLRKYKKEKIFSQSNTVKKSNKKRYKKGAARILTAFSQGIIDPLAIFFNSQAFTFLKKWSVFDQLKADFDPKLIIKQLKTYL